MFLCRAELEFEILGGQIEKPKTWEAKTKKVKKFRGKI
jgi:hypothetical protein